ncbi:MAG: glutathione S-transferase family protein [Myxococcota bacterium]
MSLKLYYAPQTRSTRPRWLLEELGVPYELQRVDLKAGEHKKPDYLKLNPMGFMPTLVDGEMPIFESAAIILHLADKFPEKELAPPVGSPERAAYYQWILFGMATFEPAVYDLHKHTVLFPEAERVPHIVEKARARLRQVYGVLEGALAGREYFVGNRFSAADVVMGSVATWSRRLEPTRDFPNVEAYCTRMLERPAFKRSRAE